jgi:hypothetical protein
MHDYERLKRLTGAGDVDAAKQLQREASRRGDAEGEALALATLGDGGGWGGGGVGAGAAGDGARLEVFGGALGVSLTQQQAARLDGLRVAANGRARLRLLARRHLVAAMGAAAVHPAGFGFAESSDGAASDRSSVALAVLGEGAMTVGAKRARGVDPCAAWGLNWHADRPKTYPVLYAWRDTEDADRARLPRVTSAAHAALTRATQGAEMAKAWLRQLQCLIESSDTGWAQACLLVQAAPTQALAEEGALRMATETHRTRQTGNRIWLREALALGDDAGPHWQQTRKLDITETRAPRLARTCAAMRGVESMRVDMGAVNDMAGAAALMESLARSPHLPALKTLRLEDALLDARGAQALWSPDDADSLPALEELTLKRLRCVGTWPWPPLRRALRSLTLELGKYTDDVPCVLDALAWVGGASASLESLCMDVRADDLSAPAQPVTLARARAVTFVFIGDTDPDAVNAALRGLSLPALESLTLTMPYKTDHIGWAEALRDDLERVRARCQRAQPPTVKVSPMHTSQYVDRSYR